ncbi:MAG TPA: hypothetical protein VNZ57_03360 [Longimicrobiales bacterium]|nr:hypothetical protein [Longimicrobiales bacterium]
MRRAGLVLATAFVLLPLAGARREVWAQTADGHAQGTDPTTSGHSHVAAPPQCTDSETATGTVLSPADSARLAAVHAAVAHLATPEAARAAGFQPVFGNIPTMGVHWVHPGRTRDGVVLEAPDHLLFAPWGGEERLVGVAYAFLDRPNTDEPVPFESEHAHWHDHPELAPPGESLHMMHVWFVPSSGGPFAGNNFWLPFYGAGITPPRECWLADAATAERIHAIAMTLAIAQLADHPIELPRALGGQRGLDGVEALARQVGARLRAMRERVAELDAAAREGDREAWIAAADEILASRSAAEALASAALLRRLTMAQMPSNP